MNKEISWNKRQKWQEKRIILKKYINTTINIMQLMIKNQNNISYHWLTTYFVSSIICLEQCLELIVPHKVLAFWLFNLVASWSKWRRKKRCLSCVLKNEVDCIRQVMSRMGEGILRVRGRVKPRTLGELQVFHPVEYKALEAVKEGSGAVGDDEPGATWADK